MSAYKRFLIQKAALKSGDLETVKKIGQEARKELLSKGFVQRKPTFNWIEKEWFDKAVAMGAVVEKIHPDTGIKIKDYWAVTVRVIEMEKQVRGKTIKEKKTSCKKWTDWSELYENHNRQEAANEANWKGIMASEEKQSTFIA